MVVDEWGRATLATHQSRQYIAALMGQDADVACASVCLLNKVHMAVFPTIPYSAIQLAWRHRICTDESGGPEVLS